VRPESLEIRIIDALEREVNKSPHLPDHGTVLYKRARAVLPSDCPLLQIFLVQKLTTAETVVYFDNAIGVGIVWQEEGVQEVTTLIDDPEAAKSQLRAISAIEEVIFRLGIDGLAVEPVEVDDGSGREADQTYAIFPVSIDLSEPVQVEEGLVEGYAMTVEVDVTQTKQGG
jgi:hypothetical protein